MSYVLLAAVVFGVNLLPAFGPPTWAILVLFKLNRSLPSVPLVVVGALAAAAGRMLLAYIAGHFGRRVFASRQARIDEIREQLVRRRSATALGLGLFALSPIPSGQLFVAAGMMRVRLLPLTLAFFAGRVVSYTGYVTAASLAKRSAGDIALTSLRSPAGIAVQVVLLVALTTFPLWLSKRRPTP